MSHGDVVRVQRAAASIWDAVGLEAAALRGISYGSTTYRAHSSFLIAQAAQLSIGLTALAFAGFHICRGGAEQNVDIEAAQAFAEFRSEQLLEVDGNPQEEFRDPISRLFQTADGWVRVHANFPHHRDGVLALLKADNDPRSVQDRLRHWNSEDFETAAAQVGLCVSALRDFAQWDAHEQAAAVRDEPLIRLTRVDGPPAPIRRAGAQPLEGVHVLDLTRVIAGPVCGRILAGHGADVMRIAGPHLPTIPALDNDTGRGKRSCALDLRTDEGRRSLDGLVADADVFLDAFRPGALEMRGYGWRDLITARPGLIVASLSAYGWGGAWAGRRGYDSLVQTATGFNAAEASAFGESSPRPLPVQALDHASGYLLALGIAAALSHQARNGGSWRVQVSLARTAQWLRELGRGRPEELAEGTAVPKPHMIEAHTPTGRMRYVEHAARLSLTPVRWNLSRGPNATDAPRWLCRSVPSTCGTPL